MSPSYDGPAMERFFNTAGPCNPKDHYMLPWEDRIQGIREFIDDKLYFVIHAPRQVGKTTSFRHLAETLMLKVATLLWLRDQPDLSLI